MDKKKISQLTQGTPLNTDVIPYVDLENNETKKAIKSELKGDQGDQGDAATLDVGTTTTGLAGTDASVVNVGSTSEAVFNFTIPRGDKGETGDTGDTGAKVTSVAFVDNNIVFTLDDASTVTLTDAKVELKGDKGDTGAKITSGEFVGDDLVFTLDDASTVTVTNAKIDLKGDKGDTGDTGDEVELRKTATHIEWKLSEETNWNELVALSELKGDKGDTGDDGEEVSLQKTATHIQWKLGDGDWQDLVALSELKGEDGVSFEWKGEWSAGTYDKDDVVERLGSTYIANKETSETPSGSATDWDLMAKKGTDGEGSGDMLKSVYDPAGGEKQVAFDDDARLSDDRTPTEHGNEKHSENYIADIESESIADLSDVDDTGKDTGKILKYNAISGNWEIGDDALLKKETIEIEVSDWTNEEATKTVSGLKSDSIVWVSPRPDSYNSYIDAQIRATSQDTNELTFKCEEAPTESIFINIAFE